MRTTASADAQASAPRCWRSAAWLTSAQAQEAGAGAGPDSDFLEYLGAWAEEDDEWLAIEEWQKGERRGARRSEEIAEGSESREDDDDESE